jgi:uncharacterized protein involved in type VI secretion and phage assembly
MSDPHELLNTMSARGKRALDLASVICRLVTEGAELGALEDLELQLADGSTKTIRIIPRQWLERLQRAVNVGAFERLTVEQIVERILLPPLPDQVET